MLKTDNEILFNLIRDIEYFLKIGLFPSFFDFF